MSASYDAAQLKRAIAHLARGVAEMQQEAAPIYGSDPSLAEISLPRDCAIGLALIQHLDAADAIEDADNWALNAISAAVEELKRKEAP